MNTSNDNKPYWWPDMQGFAVVAIIIIAATALLIRMFHTSNVDDKMLDTMITILFSTCLVSVFNYLFGSSRGSSSKDDTINKIAATATVPPDPNKPDTKPADVVKALAFVAVLLASSFMLYAGPASAQVKLGPIGQRIADDVGGKVASAPADIASILGKPFMDIANFIGADAEGAITLATAVPSLQDGHGQQCWIEMKSFGDVIKAHPVPVTFHVIQDYEALRLLGMATNRLCSNTHCTQVFADFTGMAQAASPMPLAIPSLHDLCTKVPQIAVVDPVKLPVPATTPEPAK